MTTKRAHLDVPYELEEISGEGFVAHITAWGGQRCRITTRKASEDEAREAAEAWIEHAVSERTNPNAPTYRWVPDDTPVHAGGFVCARMTDDGSEPVLR